MTQDFACSRLEFCYFRYLIRILTQHSRHGISSLMILFTQEFYIILRYSDIFMMTSSKGNIFRVTGPFCGEFTGHRSALMFSLICARINGWVNNRESGDLRRHRAHHDVIVMVYFFPYESTWFPKCGRQTWHDGSTSCLYIERKCRHFDETATNFWYSKS